MAGNSECTGSRQADDSRSDNDAINGFGHFPLCDAHLARMKTLGPPAARSRFYTAQSHQPPKGILGKPRFRQLRPVTAHQDSDFRLHLRAIEPDIGVWRQQAAIVLGNLVLENEM